MIKVYIHNPMERYATNQNPEAGIRGTPAGNRSAPGRGNPSSPSVPSVQSVPSVPSHPPFPSGPAGRTRKGATLRLGRMDAEPEFQIRRKGRNQTGNSVLSVCSCSKPCSISGSILVARELGQLRMRQSAGNPGFCHNSRSMNHLQPK
jgi:hypothetical protein